jgi:hypothetical protein
MMQRRPLSPAITSYKISDDGDQLVVFFYDCLTIAYNVCEDDQ